MTKEEWNTWKNSEEFTKAKEQAANELREIELIMNSTPEIENHEQPIVNFDQNETVELCGSIRIREIHKRSYETIPIIGTVIKSYGPTQIEKSTRFKCKNCEDVIEFASEFPYDNKVKTPDQFCWATARDGNRCKWERLTPLVDGSRVLYRVSLVDSMSYFTFHLLDNQTPPNSGDRILFESTIQANYKDGKSVIDKWCGEGTSYEVLAEQ